jgi:hypothetical protein
MGRTVELGDSLGLIARSEALEAERLRRSREQFGHDGAAIPGTFMDWRAEALSLEAQLAGAVEENDRLRGLWRDEALVTRLFDAHMRGDVAAALRDALGGR